MKTKTQLLTKIIVLHQSNWLKPALLSLALVGAVLGVTGCGAPHH